MPLKARLGKVEANLEPKEAFLLWLSQAHQFASDLDYRRWLSSQPADVYPLVRMCDQVSAYVITRAQDSQLDPSRNPIRQGHYQVTILYFLHEHLNHRVELQSEFLRLHALLLLERLLRLSAEKSLAGLAGKKTAEAMEIIPRKEQWLDDLGELDLQVRVLATAAAQVSERHFWGEPSLFPAQARALKCLEGLVDLLARGFAAVFLDAAPADATLLPPVDAFPIDLPPAADVDSLAESYVEDFRVMARARALEAMGKRESAIALTEKHLFH